MDVRAHPAVCNYLDRIVNIRASVHFAGARHIFEGLVCSNLPSYTNRGFGDCYIFLRVVVVWRHITRYGHVGLVVVARGANSGLKNHAVWTGITRSHTVGKVQLRGISRTGRVIPLHDFVNRNAEGGMVV